jgi:hypothetical protein
MDAKVIIPGGAGTPKKFIFRPANTLPTMVHFVEGDAELLADAMAEHYGRRPTVEFARDLIAFIESFT